MSRGVWHRNPVHADARTCGIGTKVLNSDIDYRHFYLEGALNREESSDQLNQRYLRGAMKTGCQATLDCVTSARTTLLDVDFLAVCTCTGYVCPDVGSRLIAHMGFSDRESKAGHKRSGRLVLRS